MNLLKTYLTFLIVSSLQAATVSSFSEPQGLNKTGLSIAIKISPDELLYADTLMISSNNPDVNLSPFTTDKQPEILYDQNYKKNMAVYKSDITITTEAIHTHNTDLIEPQLHISFITNLSHQPSETIVPIVFEHTKKSSTLASDVSVTNEVEKNTLAPQPAKLSLMKQWAKRVQETLTQTESWSMRLLFAFFLGLLMSLTPCIYPMVPITVGILKSQGSSSLLRNFLLSLTYTFGLATTFACLGFIAATSGSAFGHLMGNPLFVIAIVMVLGYFAFSLFGFYPLYIPRFLQQKQSFSNKGSFLSIFIFGLASGSVASPCLSPGLALVLTMVASIANKTLGFLLLFLFGIGVSFPLLIIGTFSSSLTFLPRAGMWMIEIQKFFGFMLLGMCLYYISSIVPPLLVHSLTTLFVFIITIYYYYTISPNDSFLWRYFKTLLSIIAGGITLFSGTQTIQEYYYNKSIDQTSHWYTDYDKAIVDAQKENKKVMLDFWAPYCSVCKLITKNVLEAPAVHRALDQNYIIVSVNGNDAQAEPYKTLRERYNVQGFPDIILIDPATQKIIHRFGAELLDIDHQEFIALLK